MGVLMGDATSCGDVVPAKSERRQRNENYRLRRSLLLC